ncbi:hypothetical protein UPYG_G00299220 [Umbra pygmaea]|uniref:Uncharacterized protein n=1 Tax=Umbra pygmaea TaxID=75934 RepID=A0ABD0WR07_UMBPY
MALGGICLDEDYILPRRVFRRPDPYIGLDRSDQSADAESVTWDEERTKIPVKAAVPISICKSRRGCCMVYKFCSQVL